MKIKSTLILFSSFSLIALVSCQSPKDKIAKKWQVTSLEDKQNDSTAEAFLKSIDTISVIDPMMSMAYGTTDLDSLKNIIREETKLEIEQRKESAKMINLDFKKNGELWITSADKVDSTKLWSLVDKNTLIMKAKNPGEDGAVTDSFSIEKLTSGEMKLKMLQVPRDVYLNLHPYTAKDSTAAIEVMEKFQKKKEAQIQAQQEMQQHQQQEEVKNTN